MLEVQFKPFRPPRRILVPNVSDGKVPGRELFGGQEPPRSTSFGTNPLPALAGYLMDEQGNSDRHMNLFLSSVLLADRAPNGT